MYKWPGHDAARIAKRRHGRPLGRPLTASGGARAQPTADGLRLDVEEARDGEVPLAGVVGEGQDAGPVLDLGQLLGDGREDRAGRDADEQALLAGRALGVA